jgi:hypothetical protein
MAFNMKRKLTSKGLVSKTPIRQVHGGQIPIDPNAGEGSVDPNVGRVKQSDIDYTTNGDDFETVVSFIPGTGEAIDAKNTVKDLLNKDYTGAALNAAGFFIPFVPGSVVKGGAKKIKEYIFKNVKGSKEAVKKSAKHMDHAGNYWKNPEDAAKINQSFTNTILETPTQKLLGETPKSVRFGEESLETMMAPVDVTNTKTLSSGFEVPTNMTWFSPNAGQKTFDIPGRNKFEAIILPQKPYVVASNDVWGATTPSKTKGYKSIKTLLDEGYDAIKVVTPNGVHEETIVLDKSIIDIVKK